MFEIADFVAMHKQKLRAASNLRQTVSFTQQPLALCQAGAGRLKSGAISPLASTIYERP
jgi:hypothetical protein